MSTTTEIPTYKVGDRLEITGDHSHRLCCSHCRQLNPEETPIPKGTPGTVLEVKDIPEEDGYHDLMFGDQPDPARTDITVKFDGIDGYATFSTATVYIKLI